MTEGLPCRVRSVRPALAICSRPPWARARWHATWSKDGSRGWGLRSLAQRVQLVFYMAVGQLLSRSKLELLEDDAEFPKAIFELLESVLAMVDGPCCGWGAREANRAGCPVRCLAMPMSWLYVTQRFCRFRYLFLSRYGYLHQF